MAEKGDAENPAHGAHVYMIAGTDEYGDCHCVFTHRPVCAVGHFKPMSRCFSNVRGNDSLQKRRPLISTFDADAQRFGQ